MKSKRIEDYNKILPIMEVYRCVQSEGSRFGRPTIAIRTTGCTHRCMAKAVGGGAASSVPSSYFQIFTHNCFVSP